MEELKVEEPEDAEVFCGNCIGDLITLEVQKQTARLFKAQYYKRLIMQCNHCGKTTKEFTVKNK